MSPRPDALDELVQRLDAEIEPGMQWLTDQLKDTDQLCQQVMDSLPPSPWDEAP